MRYIDISDSERQEIEQIIKDSRCKTIRNRCSCILLSAKRISTKGVAIEAGVSWHTVHRLIRRWNAHSGYRAQLVYIAHGRGAKRKLAEFPMISIIKRLLEKYDRDLNKILYELRTTHDTTVCKKTLRNFIKYYNL